MSTRTAKWAIWLLLCCLLPVPYFLVGVEVAPLVRLAFFAGIIVLLNFSEGTGGPYWWAFLGLALSQSAVIGGILYAVAKLGARLLDDLAAAQRARLILGCALLAAALCVTFRPYSTPMSSSSMHSGLLQVFH